MVPSIGEAAVQGDVLNGDSDIPALVAMVLGMCLGHVRASAVILLMLTGGEAFEEFALRRASTALHALLEMSPGTAHIEIAGVVTEISSEKVNPGDRLLVKPQCEIPVDGVVVSGTSVYVNECLLTGENWDVSMHEGDTVMAGSRNKGSAFYMVANGRYNDSIIAIMKLKLSQALEKKGRLELESKKLVSIFTPLTFAIAGVSAVVSSLIRKMAVWDSVLAVFMAATPCPAGIGVPIAMLSGMSMASGKLGITIKNGGVIEEIAKATCVVLDKTGTLTMGRPLLKRLVVQGDMDDDQVLRILASLEKYSTHPIARAVCNTVPDKQLFSVIGVEIMVGHGIKGTVGDGYRVLIGSSSVCGEVVDDILGMHTYFIIECADGAVLKGAVEFADSPRDSARAMVDRLKLMELRLVILSGDRSYHLEELAEFLGISEFKSCLPAEKATYVETLQREGEVVIMIGDGGNDALALSVSNVGMSLGACNFAADSASAVMMNEDLENVPRLIEMSRKVVTIATRTVRYGMSCSFFQMGVAALGFASPFQSAVMQEFIDLAAVLHSLQALTIKF